MKITSIFDAVISRALKLQLLAIFNRTIDQLFATTHRVFWRNFLLEAYVLKIALEEIKEVEIMKPMIWHPEEKDQRVNQYLEQINHAPYITIIALVLGLFCLFSFIILVGSF